MHRTAIILVALASPSIKYYGIAGGTALPKNEYKCLLLSIAGLNGSENVTRREKVKTGRRRDNALKPAHRHGVCGR